MFFAVGGFELRRAAATRDLPTIASIRFDLLLRRCEPVPGILAAGRTGAIMDKSGRRLAMELERKF